MKLLNSRQTLPFQAIQAVQHAFTLVLALIQPKDLTDWEILRSCFHYYGLKVCKFSYVGEYVTISDTIEKPDK